MVDARSGHGIAGAPILYAMATKTHYFNWGERHGYDYNSGPLDRIRRVTSNEQGRFRLADTPDELGILFILHGEYERLTLYPEDRVTDPATGVVRVELKPEASISGICSIDDEPHVNTQMRLWLSGQRDKPEQGFEWPFTDEDGRYRFGNLGPGTYVVISLGTPDKMGMRRKCKLSAGEHKRLNLGDDLGPYTLRGRTFWRKKPMAWMNVSVQPAFDWEYTKFEIVSNAEGRYEIKGLRAGRYHVAHYHPSYFFARYGHTIEISGDRMLDLPADAKDRAQAAEKAE